MKELIASLLLSFFIAETAQAVITDFSKDHILENQLDSLLSDLE